MLRSILLTLYYLIFTPQKGWNRINDKFSGQQEFINNYLFPIFGFIAITTFIGGMWLVEDGNIYLALKKSIVAVSTLFGGFFASSYLLSEFFPKVGLNKNLAVAQQFVGYSSAIIYLLYFLMPLLPDYPVFWMLTVFSIYLIYSGSTVFLVVDENKKTLFSVVAFFTIVLTTALINFLLSLLISYD